MGGALKVRWNVKHGDGWVEFSPADLYVEFNGQEIEFLQELAIVIKGKGPPEATMRFTLSELDIDADTLLALTAYVEQQKGVGNGE